MKAGLPLVIDARVEALIVGSFPSERSLQQQHYYAHPRNQFWRLVSAVLNCPLTELTYPQRIEALLAQRIGLWNVLAACERQGSLDSGISKPRYNDFSTLHRRAPALNTIYLNGKLLMKYAPLIAAHGFHVIALPASSPAYTLSFDQKLAAWRVLTRASPTGARDKR